MRFGERGHAQVLAENRRRLEGTGNDRFRRTVCQRLAQPHRGGGLATGAVSCQLRCQLGSASAALASSDARVRKGSPRRAVCLYQRSVVPC